MKRFETINDLEMIQVGDYNWRVLKENDGSIFYHLVVSRKVDSIRGDKNLLYDVKNGVLSIGDSMGGNSSRFKIDFDKTPMFVKSLIDGESGILSPIYHKDTVKIK